MNKKNNTKRNRLFHGDLNSALHAYLGNDEHNLADNFWHSDAIATAIENADNAQKSLHVLRKHLPNRFQPLIRFAQPNITWYINVESGTVATQLNMILDELLLRIAKDIGFAPRMKVSVQPSHKAWEHSGFPLKHEKLRVIEKPNEAEAQAFLTEFLKKLD